MNPSHDRLSIDRLDLNLLRVFDVVYREGHMTRAATRLYLSQSAVSHALARLRDHLGDVLFVREGRGVVPTARAHRLAPVVQEALDALRRGIEGESGFDPHRDARLFWLNLPEQMEPLWLPPLVERLRRLAPAVELRCSSTHWQQVHPRMQAGEIDLAIEITRATDGRLRQKRLLSDPFCVLVGPDFEGPLDADRYLAAAHVAVSSRRRALCAEDLALGQLGLSRQVRQHCQNYVSAAWLVAKQGLLLTAPRRYLSLVDPVPGNRILPMPLPLPPLTLSLYWLRSMHEDAANHWLRAHVMACAESA